MPTIEIFTTDDGRPGYKVHGNGTTVTVTRITPEGGWVITEFAEVKVSCDTLLNALDAAIDRTN